MRRRDLMLLAGGASVASLRTGVAQQPSAIPIPQSILARADEVIE